MDKVLFAQIIKVDVAKRQVTGRATQEVKDRANEIFDYATSKPLFVQWSNGIAAATKAAGQEVSLGNIRAMHGKVAAGKVVEITFNDAEKAIDIVSEIVDDAEWTKVEKGLYTGYSIGGGYVKKWKDASDNGATRFTADPVEISIVDLPCVPTATFSMIKGDGLAEDVAFVVEKTDPAEGSETGASSESAAPADAPEVPPVDVAAEVSVPAVVAEQTPAAVIESPAVLAARQALADAIAADDAARVAAEQAAADAAKAASAPVTKTAVEKGMYSVGQFADMLQTIAWMAQDAEWEKGWEKDASTIPEELKAWLALGTEIFKKMSAEETAELVASLTTAGDTAAVVVELAAGGDLGKAGARHSKADLAKVQGIHDHAVSLGANCSETEKAAPTPMEKLAGAELSELGKAVALATGAEPTSAAIEPEQITALAKFALALSAEKTAMAAEIAVLKQAPADPKGVARVVGKADDATDLETPAPTDIKPNPADPRAVMKAVHATGGRRVM